MFLHVRFIPALLPTKDGNSLQVYRQNDLRGGGKISCGAFNNSFRAAALLCRRPPLILILPCHTCPKPFSSPSERLFDVIAICSLKCDNDSFTFIPVHIWKDESSPQYIFVDRYWWVSDVFYHVFKFPSWIVRPSMSTIRWYWLTL